MYLLGGTLHMLSPPVKILEGTRVIRPHRNSRPFFGKLTTFFWETHDLLVVWVNLTTGRGGGANRKFFLPRGAKSFKYNVFSIARSELPTLFVICVFSPGGAKSFKYAIFSLKNVKNILFLPNFFCWKFSFVGGDIGGDTSLIIGGDILQICHFCIEKCKKHTLFT